MIGTEIERLSVLIENALNNGFSDNATINELCKTIGRPRKQVVLDKNHAFQPSTMKANRDDGENTYDFS